MLGSAFLAMQIGTIQAWGFQPPPSLTQYAHRQWCFDDAGFRGTPQNLTQWDKKGVTQIHGFPLAGAPDISHITEDRNENIWAVVEDFRTRAPLLLPISNGEVFRHFDAGAALTGQEINTLAPNPNGGLWVGGSAHGLFWFHEGRFERIAAHAFDDRVENHMAGKNDALWSVTPHGFLRYASVRMEKLNKIAGLPSNGGVNIQSDGAGSTLFCSHCGIAQISDIELVTAANNSSIWNSTGAKITFAVAPAWYQTLLFRWGATLLVLLMLALAYLYRLRSHRRALKLRFDTRLEERTRMARDLHDTLLQTIQGSKMVADAALSNMDDRGLTVRTLDRLSDWLDRASHEGRAALESLQTSNDEKANILHALRRAAADCSVESGTTLNVATSGDVRDLHPIAQDEIYRIGYEAIRNACLHSNAGELRIKIICHRTFRLEVHDNGQGIPEETLNFGRPGHFGLTGMRERAVRLGGKLDISSSPRQGTTISLSVPGHAVYKTALKGFRAFLPGLFTPKPPIEKDRW
jgi:signal transduction histidine kinase